MLFGYLIAIEPFPPSVLIPPPPEVTHLDSRLLQDVEPELFSSLEAGDILFIDSSHVARIGGDVVHEYLVILPALAPGVVVHIHDIFIPSEYPRQWIDEARFFGNEQYLVEAFLTFNQEFEVVLPMQALWRLHSAKISSLDPSRPALLGDYSSFWIRRRPAAA